MGARRITRSSLHGPAGSGVKNRIPQHIFGSRPPRLPTLHLPRATCPTPHPATPLPGHLPYTSQPTYPTPPGPPALHPKLHLSRATYPTPPNPPALHLSRATYRTTPHHTLSRATYPTPHPTRPSTRAPGRPTLHPGPDAKHTTSSSPREAHRASLPAGSRWEI
jgi:hypothetical protein